MTLDDFLEYVKTRKALNTEDIHRFMDEMSNEARRITFKLNASFHAPDEVRALLSELFGKPVPPSLRVFPPFYTDFGKNIEIGNRRIYQCLLSFSGSRWGYIGRRLPDRA